MDTTATSSTPPRKPSTRLPLIGMAVAVGIVATACSPVDIEIGLGTDGSGVAETVTFEVGSFDRIQADSVFDVDVDVTVEGGAHSVELTVDDNLVDEILVEVEDGQLILTLDGGNLSFDVGPTVTITMPELTGVSVDGAADITVDGLDTERFDLEVDDAASATVDGRADDINLTLAGAARAEISGAVDSVEIASSGASSADLTGLNIDILRLAASGSASVSFGNVDTAVGEVSGSASATFENLDSSQIETSGVASVVNG